MSTILSVYTNTGEEKMKMQRKKRAHTGKIATVALAMSIIGVGVKATQADEAIMALEATGDAADRGAKINNRSTTAGVRQAGIGAEEKFTEGTREHPYHIALGFPPGGVDEMRGSEAIVDARPGERAWYESERAWHRPLPESGMFLTKRVGAQLQSKLNIFPGVQRIQRMQGKVVVPERNGRLRSTRIIRQSMGRW